MNSNTRFRIYRLQIPFCLPVNHNLAKRKKTEAVLVTATCKGGPTGIGEGTPRSYVTGEDLDSCLEAARKIAGMIAGTDISDSGAVFEMLDECSNTAISQDNPSAYCAVELAFLDLHARIKSQPLWAILGEKSTDHFTYSGVIPMLGKEALARLLASIKTLRLENVKIKIDELTAGLEYIKRISSELGKDTAIRIDANGAFSAEEALTLVSKLESWGIDICAFEQPVPGSDLSGLSRVSKEAKVQVIADESFRNREEMRELMGQNTGIGFNIRVSKCGGIRNALSLYRLAQKKGAFCQIGCHVGETGILAAATRHLAALCEDIPLLEGSYSNYVLEEDITREQVTFGKAGKAALLPGPGTGVSPAYERLSRWSRMVYEI